MKICAACGASNALEARFCVNCGLALVALCGRCGGELPEGVRFCPRCGAPVAEPRSSSEERKVVTVLFADLADSTGIAERLDPEQHKEVMDAFFDAMHTELEAEGGTVEKYIGDAVMAVFGVPVAHDDDPSRAVRAALRMGNALDALNERLRPEFGFILTMRVGINTGEVVAAASPRPGERLVTGDAVNVAARLQQSAEPGQVLVANRTGRAARGFVFREIGPLALKGKDQSVLTLAVTGFGPEAGPAAPGSETP